MTWNAVTAYKPGEIVRIDVETFVSVEGHIEFTIDLRMKYGTYIGPYKPLQGKKTLVDFRDGQTMCQFDDCENTWFGFGWHEFDRRYIVLDNPKRKLRPTKRPK